MNRDVHAAPSRATARSGRPSESRSETATSWAWEQVSKTRAGAYDPSAARIIACSTVERFLVRGHDVQLAIQVEVRGHRDLGLVTHGELHRRLPRGVTPVGKDARRCAARVRDHQVQVVVAVHVRGTHAMGLEARLDHRRRLPAEADRPGGTYQPRIGPVGMVIGVATVRAGHSEPQRAPPADVWSTGNGASPPPTTGLR